jgi:hypothetical protein
VHLTRRQTLRRRTLSWRGEHDTAAEVRSVLPELAKVSSAKAALAFLNKQLGSGSAKGGQEVDQALAKLRKLGYSKGS